MSHDYPPLNLDDLVHIMSPSPAPQALLEDPDVPLRSSASPEPLPNSDIVQMRKQVIQMRSTAAADAQLTPRENELAEMVLRLTAIGKPDSEQLLRQADMISALIQQRDLLVRQAEEQHLRWNSEKDGWARTAEALLAQQAKNRLNAERDEDVERLHAAETDNKGLRQRLNETQSRLQMLESELTRLRPLLLMQPLIPRSSIPPPTPNPKTQLVRRRKKDTAATDDEPAASEDDATIDPFDTPSHTQATPRAKHRRSEPPNSAHPLTNLHKRRPSKHLRGVNADARVEHLLLAARKIGKQRVGIISEMVQHQEERERERERRREESAATAVATTPKTPKRHAAHTGHPLDGGYVYTNGQLRPGHGVQPVPLYIPAYPHHVLQTPSSSTTAPSVTSAPKSKQGARTNNPPTPLDSLLNAARSMMREDIHDNIEEDEEVDILGDSPAQTANTTRARSRVMFGSPMPKRRKVVAGTSKLSALSGLVTDVSSGNMSDAVHSGAGRVRSALDVLADQAAAFSQEPSQTTPAKGKGKSDEQRELSGSMLKSRGRTQSRKRETEADTPTRPARSRSRTPTLRLDSVDTSTGQTPTQTGGLLSKAQVDPGGGSTSDAVEALDSTLVGEVQVATDDPPCPRSPGPSVHVEDSADVTPRQGSRVQSIRSDEGESVTQSSVTHMPSLRAPENEPLDTPSPAPNPETTPSVGEDPGMDTRSGHKTLATSTKNKELVRVAEQDATTPMVSTKRQRSPYVKWSKEEDELLSQAVAKYGQKWDLVQKALPSRGYHQVRQRWLRKLGVFDSKPDLSAFQTATGFSTTTHGVGDTRGNLKLGLAPLSSEKVLTVVGRATLPS